MALGLLSSQTIQAQSNEKDPAECARRILADDAYQDDMVDDSLSAGQTAGRRSERSGDREESPSRPESHTSPMPDRSETPSQGVGRFLEILLYVGAALGALLGLFWIVDSIHRRRTSRNRPATAEAAESGARTETPIGALSTIEKLAETGDYAGAVHAMLLLAVRHLCRVCKSRPARSLTSRELVKILPRTDQERTLLSRLVTTVEVSLFGGRTVGPETYNDCFESFRELNL